MNASEGPAPPAPFADADSAAERGMGLAFVAAQHPDRPALLSEHGSRSFAALNARANQLARALRRAGLRAGDGVALLCSNRPEFAEVFAATQRAGLRLTPINWHLAAADVAYIAADSGARALVAEARFAESALAASRAAGGQLAVALSLAGELPGFGAYEARLAAESPEDLADPQLGDTMLYTSGTTGRPKGVRRPPPDPARSVVGFKLLAGVFGFRPDAGDVTLATGPLYHTGPLNLCLAIPLGHGITTILMDRWRPEEMLRLIEAHRVTHTYCVPTMFHRLLALPTELRERYDLSSLRFLIHGAAPCPVADKRAIIAWLGPIVTEIYAATEGMGTLVSSEEWLRKPGTVGRPLPGAVRILDEHGAELPPREVGTVFLRPVSGGEFAYHGSAEDSPATRRDGAFTVGDLGYLDEDGYLFLTGRSAEVVITGGSNVYPAEIDELLRDAEGVADAAAFGVPDAEWGEVVCAAVVPAAGVAADDAFADALLAAYRKRLPSFKAPRRIEFVDEIPRSEAGKIVRRLLRDRFGARGA